MTSPDSFLEPSPLQCHPAGFTYSSGKLDSSAFTCRTQEEQSAADWRAADAVTGEYGEQIR